MHIHLQKNNINYFESSQRAMCLALAAFIKYLSLSFIFKHEPNPSKEVFNETLCHNNFDHFAHYFKYVFLCIRDGGKLQ